MNDRMGELSPFLQPHVKKNLYSNIHSLSLLIISKIIVLCDKYIVFIK